MDHFTPGSALLGGVLIGLAASVLLYFNGRVAGATSILAGVLRPARGETAWRAAFLGGLAGGGALAAMVAPQALQYGLERGPLVLLAAGVLVGFGARLGGGCTSGHGVCGVARLSPRSLVATGTFIVLGMGAVAVVGRLMGGAL